MTDDSLSGMVPRLRDSRIGDLCRSYGHLAVLLLMMTFMFVTRARSYERFKHDGQIVFAGTDAWYHYREVSYAVEHWPATLPFDAWTGYPTGNSLGQFGTLYDQLIALVALIVGLGSPTDQTIRLVMIFTPPVIGTLVAIPTYFLATHLTDGRRWTGVLAVGFLALLPGSFFQRSLIGFVDHHIVETLLMTAAALTLTIALAKASDEQPIYELIVDREFGTISESVKWSALAGVMAALYMWVWPPGLLFIGIAGIFFFVNALYANAQNRPAEPTLFVGAVSMGIAGALMLVKINMLELSVVDFSPVHVLAPWAVAVGCIFLAALARLFDGHENERTLYPASVLATTGGVIGILHFVAPRVLSLIISNFIRVFGLGIHATNTKTIQEAQPMFHQNSAADALLAEYGALFAVAIVGAAILLYDALWNQKDRHMFLAIWGTLLAFAAFTQVRFNYYLAVVVAIFAAYAITKTVTRLELAAGFPRDLQGYQIIALVFIAILIVPTLFVPVAGGVTVFDQSNSMGPGDYPHWEDSLEWMSENTPAEGTYGGANNPMDPYATYERTDDFDYPDGAYGVMSWWDYGHLITVEGNRIPVANPFQQHAKYAARYLLATDEAKAQQIVTDMDSDDANVRYTMIDWQMVHPRSKFTAPTRFHPNATQADYLQPVYLSRNGQLQYATAVRTQQYYESMMVRMYRYHGSAVDPSPVVTRYATSQAPNGQTVPVYPQRTPFVTKYENMSAARNAAAQSPTAQVGGVGGYPSERVGALEHYRLVHASDKSALDGRVYPQLTILQQQLTNLPTDEITPDHTNWVKTFERVDGATITGTAPANTTVNATVTMQMPNSNETFTYTQYAETGADGTFTMTVPYATTGYDKWGTDEGYTDTNVQATGPYELTATTGDTNTTTWTATAHVTEGQVIGEDDSETTVALGNTSDASAADTAPAANTAD